MDKRSVLLAVLVFAVGALPAAATLSHRTFAHANLCSPATNDLTRTTNGIRNNTTGNRSVYCGLESHDGASSGYIQVSVALRNYGAVERTVSCYWTSGSPLGGGYATATTTVALPVDSGAEPHIAYAYDLARPTAFAMLGLRCALPPGVAMEAIEAYANTP
jgi:hypothetical protein